jgi:glycosyltransferase involved in cell wall biosynthesis
MKVLMFTTHLNVGGVSTYVVTLAKYLKQKGVDVVCASGGGRLVPELDKCGIKHYEVPIITKSELHIKLFFCFLKLIEIINAEEITIIHAHTRVSQLVAHWLRKVCDIRCVTTCHGFYKRRLGRFLIPAWGEKVVAISDPVRAHLVNDFHVAKSQIALIYNGVEPDHFDVKLNAFDKEELRRYYKVGAGGMIVGGISRLEEVKGYQFFIRAIPAVLEKFPDTKFILIGDGKYKKHLVKLARKLKIKDKIVFTGKVEGVDVALGLIDIFVHPAIWEEGFGLAVLEAMAAGKPIIASNTGGVYALVKDGKNGWLLPPREVDALSAAIIKMIESPDLMRSMGEASQCIAREKFSMDRMADEMIAMYNDLLGPTKES